jgi:hypothetical protein
MNLGPIIEVAIGLIFVWIVLSLTTIQIQEWVNAIKDKRSKDLEDAIEEMLANENLKAQFYDHPVIRGLTSKKRTQPSKTAPWLYRLPLIRGFTKEKRKLPSYIPRQQFSLALFELALTAGTESSLLQQGLLKIRKELHDDQKSMTKQKAVIEELNIIIEVARSAASTEAGTAFTKHTLETVKQQIQRFQEKYPHLKPVLDSAIEQARLQKGEIDELLKNKNAPHGDDALANLRRGITALSVISPEVNQTLNALLLNLEDYVTQGETHIARARQNVERWFDDSMDRVSGVFKRYSQWLALVIGFLVALFMNVDSISLTQYLWREPAVRAVLADKAQSFELDLSGQATGNDASAYDAMQSFREQFAGLNLPIGWTLKANDDPIFTGSTARCSVMPAEDEYFGISFSGRLIPFFANKCFSPTQPEHSTNIFIKLLGIMITAVAAQQGAPFWFDMLKRVVNLRYTGANPSEKGK